MKNDSGLTLTSIIIYVIAMVIVIGIVATITSFFYTNVINLSDNSNHVTEITKFHMYFLEEIKKQDNEITKLENSSIAFISGNTFSFQDQAIYLNKIRICENVSNLQFSVEEINEKQVVHVLITVGNENEYTKTTDYVIETR